LRSILGSFLFQGDDVFKKIKVLSGGEKSRVALAKTLIGQANFLLLDEPTNHLDIQSVNVLVEALNGYDGSYIIVSHDRHFISKTANKIWWIEDGELMEYPGTYAEWQLYQEQRELEKEQQQASPPPKKNAPKQREQRNFTTEEQHKQKQLKKQLNQAEDRVQELENQKALLETELAEPAVYQNETKLADLNSKYTKLKEALEQANAQWEELVVELEEFEA
jgi:ATP-binding cassette subfamily F protein 3